MESVVKLLISYMYRKVKTNVFSNGIKSPPFCSSLGVRQGECLSPFLLAIYVNGLENYLRGANAGMTISDVFSCCQYMLMTWLFLANLQKSSKNR